MTESNSSRRKRRWEIVMLISLLAGIVWTVFIAGRKSYTFASARQDCGGQFLGNLVPALP